MPLPREEWSWEIVYSPLSSASEKAAARARISDIEQAKRDNAERERRYHERQRYCPHCGAKL